MGNSLSMAEVSVDCCCYKKGSWGMRKIGKRKEK